MVSGNLSGPWSVVRRVNGIEHGGIWDFEFRIADFSFSNTQRSQ